jgi:hypothetical protein
MQIVPLEAAHLSDLNAAILGWLLAAGQPEKSFRSTKTNWVLGIGLKSCVRHRAHGATICLSEVRDILYCKPGARVSKNFGAPLATKFT